MSEQKPIRLWSAFRLIVRARWLIIAVYAVLLGPAVFFALKVPLDNSIDRLIVKDDPDYLASRAFAKVFGESEYIVLLSEAADPFDAFLLAMAQAGEADYLVTGDHRAGLHQLGHFGRTRIVTPAVFCTEVR